MINVGNFFALARAQVGRQAAEVGDQTLNATVPVSLRPTAQSVVRRVMESFVHHNEHLAFAATCAWLQDDPRLILDYYKDEEAMEARARAIDAGAIAVPADAPCRSWPYVTLMRTLVRGRTLSVAVHGRMQPILGQYTDGLLADIRHLVTEPEGPVPWVHLSEFEQRGLAWVLDDDGSEYGRDSSVEVIRQLLEEQDQHWYRPEIGIPAWTADSIARWAGVCWKYVTAKRGM